jgi:polynucleotide 5'-hydroxyl-kinase GRC3/NOL9
MVKGPAMVTVRGPSCHVLGVNVSDRIISVRTGKALPFEITGKCRLNIKLWHSGRIWRADPSAAGSGIWHYISNKILSSKQKEKAIKVMLLGNNDTGKSTFSTYLANLAIGRGLKPYIIDGDIGQGDLAPPCTIGAAFLSRQIMDLREIRANFWEFVGDLSPAGIEYVIIKKLKLMLDRIMHLSTNNSIIVINTDGYITNGGIHYKIKLVERLYPDIIVYLDDGGDLSLFNMLYNKLGLEQIVLARASTEAYKTRAERKEQRLDQFLRYIGKGSVKVRFEYISFAYMNSTFTSLTIPHFLLNYKMKPVDLERMFVALGSRNEIKGFAMIKRLTSDRLFLQTDVKSFDTVYLSNNIRIDKDEWN